MLRFFQSLPALMLAVAAFSACDRLQGSQSAQLAATGGADCDDLKTQRDQAKTDLDAAVARQNASCTSSGGLVDDTGTCRCSDGTPVFKLHGAQCPKPPTQNDNCAASGGTVDTTGMCRCGDGTPVFKLHGAQCPKPAQNASCTASGGTVDGSGMCRCDDGTPVFKLHGARCSADVTTADVSLAGLAARLADLDTKLTQCTASTASDMCTSAGGKRDAASMCRCSDGTPVFRIGNATCDQFLAANASNPNDRNPNTSDASNPAAQNPTSVGSAYATPAPTPAPAAPAAAPCVCGMSGSYCAIGRPGSNALGWAPSTTCTVPQCQWLFAAILNGACGGVWYHGREQ